mmetsp:Transcript_5320/g.7857  ORF Transcript_5320/g.7857 Transcript_5320/m.7857 type:complete len:1044 (+) Transcript_5320:213-3344(+)|eukprot:CAMPEP_0117423642 /NCGR_PEP_ID=MMETSP0758-20121206/4215_1 /TAXON_ID=63605 /ORGANISM="Percolomonas cosmopolitus, Strain AE-1 (ATCC 50343)" /LENGTH=1043 /DNA_ID=CAMNT_0005206933 /DNA_START=109 /DNA_END=3243 /DNA_ORIENTATION=+
MASKENKKSHSKKSLAEDEAFESNYNSLNYILDSMFMDIEQQSSSSSTVVSKKQSKSKSKHKTSSESEYDSEDDGLDFDLDIESASDLSDDEEETNKKATPGVVEKEEEELSDSDTESTISIGQQAQDLKQKLRKMNETLYAMKKRNKKPSPKRKEKSKPPSAPPSKKKHRKKKDVPKKRGTRASGSDTSSALADDVSDIFSSQSDAISEPDAELLKLRAEAKRALIKSKLHQKRNRMLEEPIKPDDSISVRTTSTTAKAIVSLREELNAERSARAQESQQQKQMLSNLESHIQKLLDSNQKLAASETSEQAQRTPLPKVETPRVDDEDIVHDKHVVQMLRQQIDDERERNHTLRLQNQMLQKEKELDISTIRAQCDEQLYELQRVNQDLQRSLSDAQSQLSQRVSDLEKISLLETEKERLSEQLSNSKNEMHSLQSMIQDQRDSAAMLREKEEKFRHVEAKYESMINQMTQFRDFALEVEEKNKSLVAESNSLREQLSTKVTSQQHKYDDIITKMTSALENANSDQDTLRKRIGELVDEKGTLEIDLETASAERDRLSHLVKHLQEDAEDAKVSIEKLKQQREVDLKAAEEAFQEKLQAAFDREQESKSDLGKRSDEIEALQDQIRHLETAAATHKGEFDEKLESELEERSKLNQMLLKSKRRIEHEIEYRLDMKKRLQEREMELERTNKQLIALQKQHDKLNELNKEMQANMNVYKEMYNSLSGNPSDSPRRHQYMRLRQSQFELEDTARSHEEAMKQCFNRYHHASDELTEIKRQIQKMNDRMDDHIKMAKLTAASENGPSDAEMEEVGDMKEHMNMLNKMQDKADRDLREYKQKMEELMNDFSNHHDDIDGIRQQLENSHHHEALMVSSPDGGATQDPVVDDYYRVSAAQRRGNLPDEHSSTRSSRATNQAFSPQKKSIDPHVHYDDMIHNQKSTQPPSLLSPSDRDPSFKSSSSSTTTSSKSTKKKKTTTKRKSTKKKKSIKRKSTSTTKKRKSTSSSSTSSGGLNAASITHRLATDLKNLQRQRQALMKQQHQLVAV